MRVENYTEYSDGEEFPFVSIGVRWVAETPEDEDVIQQMMAADLLRMMKDRQSHESRH